MIAIHLLFPLTRFDPVSPEYTFAPTVGGILNVSILYMVSYAILLHASPLVVAEITLLPTYACPPKIGLVVLISNLLEPYKAGFIVEPDEEAIISNSASF